MENLQSLMSHWRIFVMAFLAPVLAGCANQKVTWDYDGAKNMTAWQTYAWVEVKDADLSQGYQLDGLLDRRVRRAVDQELQAMGMRKVEAAEADFLVNYLAAVKTKREESHVTTSTGYGLGSWGMGVRSETRVSDYEEGSLVIDFVDPVAKELVWRGRASSRLTEKSTPGQRTERINMAVRSIMEGFPPGAKDK